MNLSLGKFYAVVQAEKKDLKGVKTLYTRYGLSPSLFLTKESAMDYLLELVKNIQHEQSIGWRTKNNLNPTESLDFVACPVDIAVDTKFFDQRGWIWKHEKS